MQIYRFQFTDTVTEKRLSLGCDWFEILTVTTPYPLAYKIPDAGDTVFKPALPRQIIVAPKTRFVDFKISPPPNASAYSWITVICGAGAPPATPILPLKSTVAVSAAMEAQDTSDLVELFRNTVNSGHAEITQMRLHLALHGTASLSYLTSGPIEPVITTQINCYGPCNIYGWLETIVPTEGGACYICLLHKIEVNGPLEYFNITFSEASYIENAFLHVNAFVDYFLPTIA